MPRHPIPILAALLATAQLAACQGAAVVATKRATPRPTARATASSAPTSAPAPASGLLARPAGDRVEVAGTVGLEAAYAIGQGATLVSNNGAGVLRLGDAALISDQGGNLIANNGAGIISDNGGGLISDRGGSIISDNGGGYRLRGFGLLASEAPAAPGAVPEFGTVLPVAGLAVGVVDLKTGRLVPLGQDPAGRPADAVVTDAAGGFRVFLPPGVGANSVRVVGVPRTGADPRLRAALISSRLGATVALDEDTSQVANDARQIMASNFFRAITTEEGQAQVMTEVFAGLIDPRAAEELAAGAKKLIAAYRAAGVPAMARARQLAIADRLADVVLAHVDLEGLRSLSKDQLSPLGFVAPAAGQAPGEPALAALGASMATIRRAVSKVMAAERQAGRDPAAYFAAKPYIQAAAARDGEDYAIRKPADFTDFIVRGVQANPRLNAIEANFQLAQVLADEDLDLGTEEVEPFVRAQVGIGLTLALRTYTGPDPILPEVLAALAVAAATP